ncbi:MAG: hypothetical protein FWF12_00395 [Betaproteobacteria bacterium]|nr:hypothetical protein [Betaproteobacteria bacterium]
MIDPYKKMPKTLRVGCYQFDVELHERGDAEAEHSFGHMNPINQKIRLRTGMKRQTLANTFIHEVMHAIFWHQAVGIAGREGDGCLGEEEIVLKLSNGLCAFWQDNPEAVAWWQSLTKLESRS